MKLRLQPLHPASTRPESISTQKATDALGDDVCRRGATQFPLSIHTPQGLPFTAELVFTPNPWAHARTSADRWEANGLLSPESEASRSH